MSLRVAFRRLLARALERAGARGLAAAAWTGAGETCFNVRRYDEASEAFRRAIDLDPDDAARALDYANLGHSLYRLENLEEAADAYQKALELRDAQQIHDGIDSDLTCSYHVSHYLGRAKEARETYTRLMKLRGMNAAAPSEPYPILLDRKGEDLAKP